MRLVVRSRNLPAATVILLMSTQHVALLAGSAVAQQPEITFHTSSHLVLVDVVALKSGLPDKSLQRDDFQVFDNGRQVPVKTFDSGVQFTTRPLALWFVVQCNMQGYEAKGSGLFAGQFSRFQPALQYVEKQDTVAVAHWCDDGQSRLDLLPTRNLEEVTTALEQVLAPGPDTKDHDRTGELALQKTLQEIVDTTRASKPEPLPVLIFLYGDYSGMDKSEANHFIDELLETSAIAFGIRDRRSPHIWFVFGEQREIAHYIASQTGGQYFDATPQTYEVTLEKILQQLHFRYQLGFEPEVLDGKRHKLTVKLADPDKNEHKRVRLRYRAAYVPMARAGK
jgi:hypothetical protein